MKSLVEVLMERDGLTKCEAIERVKDAKELLDDYLNSEEWSHMADTICEDEFGLEPDYLFDIVSVNLTYRSC